MDQSKADRQVDVERRCLKISSANQQMPFPLPGDVNQSPPKMFQMGSIFGSFKTKFLCHLGFQKSDKSPRSPVHPIFSENKFLKKWVPLTHRINIQVKEDKMCLHPSRQTILGPYLSFGESNYWMYLFIIHGSNSFSSYQSGLSCETLRFFTSHCFPFTLSLIPALV